MNPIPSTEHFDYDTVSKRNAQLMVVYLKATLLSGGRSRARQFSRKSRSASSSP